MDYVYAKNSDTGEVGYKLVARTYELDVTEIVHVYIDDVCIDAAPNHPLWVDGYGFIPADELHVGDVVKTASGEKKQITNVETECYDEPVTVYNFEVMDWHTYYVSELEVLVHNADCSNAESGSNTLPQGISQEQFSNASKLLRDRVGDISGDIVVQGSRANGTAKPTSDIDIALRVSGDKFDLLIKQYFKTPNPGSAKERTMLHAIKTGKIQSGEAKLKGLRLELEDIFGMNVDISIIKIGGPFDNPPFIPFE